MTYYYNLSISFHNNLLSLSCSENQRPAVVDPTSGCCGIRECCFNFPFYEHPILIGREYREIQMVDQSDQEYPQAPPHLYTAHTPDK